MKKVEATSPGKIILCGEHAVVYGRPAIAVPVTDVQAQASIKMASTGGFRIIASDLKRDYLLAEAGSDDPLSTIIGMTLAQIKQTAPDVILSVTSTIPLGRGLGSGAAISTSIVRALAAFFEQTLAPAEVSKLVYEVEKLYHGIPSGIDNTVVAFEQPVYFVKGQAIERIEMRQSLTLIIGDTGVVSPTYQAVGDLRRRWQVEPEFYERYFDAIEAIVKQAKVALEQDRLSLSAFGQLMNENQTILKALQLSSPELERLIEAARQAGAMGAKLSGAGWGGNMIALVPPKKEMIEAVTQALFEAGATGVIVTNLD